jgi:hypothetical protein
MLNVGELCWFVISLEDAKRASSNECLNRLTRPFQRGGGAVFEAEFFEDRGDVFLYGRGFSFLKLGRSLRSSWLCVASDAPAAPDR